jgi:cell wall-associated NlpC family hydrolase
MQSQLAGSRKVVSGRAVAAIALCAGALSTSDARAQLAVGPVRIDVTRKSTSRVSATSASRVLPTAQRYLGVRYRWGGTSPKTGFDCSGFVQYVFAKHGTRLPRTSREQASSGQKLRPVWSALRPGDLVLFAEPGRRISHVAIYAGRRRIIHATGSGRKVRFDALDTKRGKWYARRLVAARRVSLRGSALVRDLLALQSSGTVSSLELDPPDGAPAPQ